MSDELASKTGRIKLVSVEWPTEVSPSIYATQLLAQSDGRFVYLTFAQTPPPLVLEGKGEDAQKQIEQINSIKAIPVTKVVVPLQEFRRMVQVLQEHLHNVEGLSKSETDDSADDTAAPATG